MEKISGYTRVFRAVSEEEYQQILRTGTFEIVPGDVKESTSPTPSRGARRFGEALFGPGRFRVIEADVPDDAASLYRWPNLDGFGPARFLHLDDLEGVRPRPNEGGGV